MSEHQHNHSSDEDDFISDSKLALLNKPTLWANSVLIVLVVFFLVALIWAYFAVVDQAATATGKVISSSDNKVIQSLDGGIVENILVVEGQVVNKNQALVKLNQTRYASDYQNGLAKYYALLATVARLTAETQGNTTVEFPKELNSHPELIQLETKLFQARKQSLEKELFVLNDSLRLAQNGYDMYGKLVKKGIVSRIDYDKAKRSVDDVQGQILQKQGEFREQALTELNQRKSDLASLQELLVTLQDKMTRTTLRSPVKGIIKKINIKTVGGVISPSMEIMEIVPMADYLLIETEVQPRDIAFIHIGQTADVKITSYDYSIYGSLKGKVVYISADAIDDKTQKNQTQPYYIVKIRTNKNFLGNSLHPYPIMPGMGAVVHITTGQKTIMSYLLKPLLKAKDEALRER